MKNFTMSFITKRDRVFNDYDIFDLPARNEGKLKAYASCTDARAWSHFCSDKSEHLVEIIKRNNQTCRPKYVPTDAIVNTLMHAKNAEISRLKHKIEEFEQMMAAYDQLELTCDQKCEIANAHAAIKAANKELDDMCLDLDLSGYTEGMDSEAFETGKSRGDEASLHTAHEVQKSKANEWELEMEPAPVMESKANQTGPVEPRDASTSAHDSRIEDLQDVIITKDAKLSAMQNTIAVMENDICEPYCIYAHIYTALEKIFGILCQNQKYKEYLDLLTAGTDTRGIDVKGKILFKLKVLEKFSLALIAPCSQDYPNQSQQECSCYHAQIETTFALTSPMTRNSKLDSKRALLVADIMDNQEIKEILSKDSISTKVEDDQIDESLGVDSYSIETENLNRLKNLQANYEDLLNCYENLKYEKNCLFIKCKKYEELEKEFQHLKSRLQEYNLLWNEKEHYRKRSEDLDTLKEKFLVLSEETSSIETRLTAEREINEIKCRTVDELRCENIALEKKLNDTSISFEREKNILTCKLKEYECKIMCQEQQIKSLSIQVDQLLEQEKIPSNIDSAKTIELTEEIDSLKQQIKNLQNALICDEEEKLQLQEEFKNKLELINNLKMEIEDWKSSYDTDVRNQNYKIQILMEDNKTLSKEIADKIQENSKIMDELEQKKNLCTHLQKMTENYDTNLSLLKNEKKNALFSLQLARTDSQKLIGNYDNSMTNRSQQDDMNTRYDIEDNERCLMNIVDHDNENSILLQEIQKLRADNITNISKLQDENIQNKKSLELLIKESSILRHKLIHLEDLTQQFHNLKESHDRLVSDKIRLENELQLKTSELDNIRILSRRESETLITRLQQTENLKDQLANNYQDIVRVKYSLLSDLSNKDTHLQTLTESLNKLIIENEKLRQESQRMCNLENELRNLNNAYEKLQKEFNDKRIEFDSIYKELECKTEENRELNNQIKYLQVHNVSNKNSLTALQEENSIIQTNLNTLKKDKADLLDKVKHYEKLENDLSELKLAYNQIQLENNMLQKDIETQTMTNEILQEKNKELNCQSQNLLSHNEELQKALMIAKNEIVKTSENSEEILKIKNEIETMKHEKGISHQKIRNLLNKLDESEQIIYKLNEDLLAREDKIAVLENHINQLQDEVRRLHCTLDEITESSEEMKEYSIQNINESLRKMEAHHSKATHNMRIELAKLQNKNHILENQLSATTLKSEESIQDIKRLHNERKAIATDIKHLELKSVGDSILSPNNCTVEDILASINKITQSIESRKLKNTSLEKTLLKVKSSFQLVVEKADEEKKIIDVEKQKLIQDKESAISDLHNVEKKLAEQKDMYEKQIAQDRCIINDLEAEILNQNLIIDKINKSKEDYISKLEEEIQSLHKMYETSTEKIGDLQNKIHSISGENNKNLVVLEETNSSLKEKCKEIEVLKDTLKNLTSKRVTSVWTQAEITMLDFNHKSTETSEEYKITDKVVFEPVMLEKTQKSKNDKDVELNVTKNSHDLISEILPKKEPYSLNEVQILRANIDMPSMKESNAYLEYKMNRLNFGPMETCSIPSLNISQNLNNQKSSTNEDEAIFNSALKDKFSENNNKDNSRIIDVYNLESQYVSSNKNDETKTRNSPANQSTTAVSLSSTSLSDLKNNKFNIKYSVGGEIGAKRHKSDKDLFVIFKDSRNINSPINNDNELLEIYHKDLPQRGQESIKLKDSTQQYKQIKSSDKNKSASPVKDINRKSNSNKPKLKIDIPRIVPESSSILTTSDGDNKSVNSYTYAIYSSPKKSIYSYTKSNDHLDSTNLALYDSPNTYDKLSQEYETHDRIFHERDNHSEFESNNEVHSKSHTSLLKVSSGQSSSRLNNLPKNTSLRKSDSHHKLSRVGANILLIEYSNNTSTNETESAQNINDSQETLKSENFGLKYILDTIKCENDPQNVTYDNTHHPQKSLRNKNIANKKHNIIEHFNEPTDMTNDIMCTKTFKTKSSVQKSFSEFGVLVKMDSVEEYENKIRNLTKTLENIERDYKIKIDAVKVQYDSNIKNILNEHNQGVKSIQSLHEETLQDVIKIHENEVENLRTMSIEALRKVEKLEKENHSLKTKIYDTSAFYEDQEPVNIPISEIKKRKGRSRIDTKTLTKTNVEAFNVKPKSKALGPCTCSVDMNISDTIRNIFEQVDAQQRKVAENAYLKYIANKISHSNIEALDAQELSFLHLKVCRTWKTKLSKEEALQKRIDSLESELINKQRQAQQHMAELDRKVAEERRRLQEVREAVCRTSPEGSRDVSPEPSHPKTLTAETNICNCNSVGCNPDVGARGSAGDLGVAPSVLKSRRTRMESNRAVLAKLDSEERRDRKFHDDPPIRLKRSHDRPTLRKK